MEEALKGPPPMEMEGVEGQEMEGVEDQENGEKEKVDSTFNRDMGLHEE